VRKQVEDLAAEVAAERARAEAAAEAAQRDRRLLDRLADIRSAKADDRLGDRTDDAYGAAFREAGIDPDALPPEAAGQLINARPPETATAIAQALDDWAAVRRDLRNHVAGARRLAAAARSADPDPWRNNLRDALEITDRSARLARLTALTASVAEQVLPPVSFDLLGKALSNLGAKTEAESVLRRGRRAYPSDVWLNYDLGRALEQLSRGEEAIRYYTAARTIRPETAHELAHALRNQGESEEGISVFRDLVRARPASGRHLSCLGDALQSRGLREEATQALTKAVAVLEKTIAAGPDDVYAHIQLGNALSSLGRLDEALLMYREAARLKPNSSLALVTLGRALESYWRYDEAVATYRASLQIEPEDTSALMALGRTLVLMGRGDEGITTLRQAVHLAPNNGMAHNALGWALTNTGRSEEALAEARAGVRLIPDDSNANLNLGACLLDLGRYDEAEKAFRESIKNRPDDHFALNYLAWLLATSPEHERYAQNEAVALARKAVELSPQTASYVNTLGIALYRAGQLEEAITTLRHSAVMQFGRDSSDWFFLSMALYRRGEIEEAMSSFAQGVAVLKLFRLSEADCRRFWAEASVLFGALGPGPTPYQIRTAPERAMLELRRAVAAGTVDRQSLKQDASFLPLRSRPEFQALMNSAIPGQRSAK
jgi:tetratricopeptide (TPR) repeat protein